MARRLDYWAKADTFAWLDAREAEVFARYFELGAIYRLVEELGKEANGLSNHTFYAWLHAQDGRWERFEEIRESRAYQTAEEGYAIAEKAEQETANRDRLRFEGKMRAAEHMNRQAFGKRPEVQVAVGMGGDWLEALVGRSSAGIVGPGPSEHRTLHASPKLIEAPRTVPDVSSE